jgi:hypothetical protein
MREVGPQLRVRPLGVVPAHTFQVGPQVRYMIGAIIYLSETPELYLEEVGPTGTVLWVKCRAAPRGGLLQGEGRNKDQRLMPNAGR